MSSREIIDETFEEIQELGRQFLFNINKYESLKKYGKSLRNDAVELIALEVAAEQIVVDLAVDLVYHQQP